MDSTTDHKKRIVITVSKKPHADSVSATLEPAKVEAGSKASDEADRASLDLLAALYRVLRG